MGCSLKSDGWKTFILSISLVDVGRHCRQSLSSKREAGAHKAKRAMSMRRQGMGEK